MAQLYDEIGIGYAQRRRADPRIAARVTAALGGARSVVNVGAGSGSYEPADLAVVAVEPSAEMVGQRPAGSAPALRATAERLPFPDDTFDAALAILTVHHWPDLARGLAELARVARHRVVTLSWDPDVTERYWLVDDYFPEIGAIDRTMIGSLASTLASAPGPTEVRTVPIPHDCVDGFLAAYWRRPHAYLDPASRAAISTFAKLTDPAPGLARLQRELEDGTWERKYGRLLGESELDVGYRLLVTECRPADRPGER